MLNVIVRTVVSTLYFREFNSWCCVVMIEVTWTKESELEAVRILKDEDSVLQKTQRYYHVRRQFELTVFNDVEKVRRKGGGVMVPTEDMWTIVRDIHI